MKKTTYLLLSMIFLFLSCTDDLASVRIIGEWKVSSVAITNCFDGADNSGKTYIDNNNCFEVDLLRANVCDMTLTVSEDGTATRSFISNGNSGSTNYIYTVNDESDVINFCIDTICLDAEFQEDKLVLFSPIGGGCIVEFEFYK